MRDANEYIHILFSEIATKVPQKPGIYEIWTKSELPLKVGISKNLRRRLKQHAASRQSGLKGWKENPTEPSKVTSKSSILAKHLFFDRALTAKSEYDLGKEAGRRKYLLENCYIKFRDIEIDKARKRERRLEKSIKFRYVGEVRLITPIIFLDFDGVIHPPNYLRFIEADGELLLDNDARFCWVTELWELIKDYDCDLVVHSSWRMTHSLTELKAMLPPMLAHRIQGTTGGGNRLDSIVEYVEEHRLTKFLILDDSEDEFPSGMKDLVICNGSTGVADKTVKQRIRDFLDGSGNIVSPR